MYWIRVINSQLRLIVMKSNFIVNKPWFTAIKTWKFSPKLKNLCTLSAPQGTGDWVLLGSLNMKLLNSKLAFSQIYTCYRLCNFLHAHSQYWHFIYKLHSASLHKFWDRFSARSLKWKKKEKIELKASDSLSNHWARLSEVLYKSAQISIF